MIYLLAICKEQFQDIFGKVACIGKKLGNEHMAISNWN